MNPATMTVIELIAAFRERAHSLRGQAEVFDDRADSLQLGLQDLGIDFNQVAVSIKSASDAPFAPKYLINAAMVRDAVRRHGGRTKHIAKHLNVQEPLIASIIKDPANGIYDKGRGWLAIRDEDKILPGNEARVTGKDGDGNAAA